MTFSNDESSFACVEARRPAALTFADFSNICFSLCRLDTVTMSSALGWKVAWAECDLRDKLYGLETIMATLISGRQRQLLLIRTSEVLGYSPLDAIQAQAPKQIYGS